MMSHGGSISRIMGFSLFEFINSETIFVPVPLPRKLGFTAKCSMKLKFSSDQKAKKATTLLSESTFVMIL